MKPNKGTLEQFNLQGEVEFLPSGEGRTYKVENVILKHINNDSIEYTKWTADLLSNIKEEDFRVSRPIPALNGEWVTKDGWSAWTFLDGNHDYENQIPEVISAIGAFHQAVKHISRPTFIDLNSPYKRADEYAWGNMPQNLPPEMESIVKPLYSLRKPLFNLKDQLIHGDLNPDNILISSGMKPAMIDIAPYWHPPEFALAIFAYWIGPWRKNMKVLKYFSSIENFDQMLIRAGIRMPLISNEFNRKEDNLNYKIATELILDYLNLGLS